ncbi:MAG TPA: hypothetical protein VHP83_10640, partial [Aggregatilineaceae bacterium]|nr:hypothetical protein [Aggregatilineaceae bacterium]
MPDLPSVPQTGIPPLALPPDQEQALLNRRRKADQTDPFASDPDEAVRRLGRLALRRDVLHPYDYLALADLCATLSWIEKDRRLRVYYVGKTLFAFRTAAGIAANDDKIRELAQNTCLNYLKWVLRAARVVPSRRNIAAALWAVAEAEQDNVVEQLIDEAQFLALWYVAPPHSDEATPNPEPAQVPELNEVTELYPDEVPTHGDEGFDLESSQLSVEDFAALSETRSDKSDVFTLDVEAATQAPRMPLPSIIASLSQARRSEDGEFHYGDRIDGRYEVAQVLRGGMGIVYLCYDHEDRKSVAIKTFQSKFLTNENAVAR